jgi:hypothetical protein
MGVWIDERVYVCVHACVCTYVCGALIERGNALVDQYGYVCIYMSFMCKRLCMCAFTCIAS